MTLLLTAILPVFALIACGYLAGRFNLLGARASEALNAFVYMLALPALLVTAVGGAPIEVFLEWSFVGAYAFGIAVAGIAAGLWSAWAQRAGTSGATIQAINATYGNTGYLGIPLGVAVFGEAAVLPAGLTLVVHAVLILPIVTVILERGNGDAARGTATALLSNPIIWGIAIGLVLAGTDTSLPIPVALFVDYLGDAAGPAALVAIGLFVAGQPLKGLWKGVATASVFKLVVFPAATWVSILLVFELDPMWSAMAVLMAGAPLGVTAFVLADRYGVAKREASAAVVGTTILSLFTLSILLALLVDG